MVTPSYNSKVTPIGALHAEKTAVAVSLNVFRVAFPASLFDIHPLLEPLSVEPVEMPASRKVSRMDEEQR